MSVFRRFLCLGLCFLSTLLLPTENMKAAASANTRCLVENYRFEEAMDIFSILSGKNSITGTDTSRIVPIESILDYFCQSDRLVPLSRWNSEPDIVLRADSILQNKYKFWVHDIVELPKDLSWSENPDENRNWVYHLHSFDFLWILSEAYRMTGNTAYLTRGIELTLDYIDDNCDPLKQTCALSWSDHTVSNRMIFLTDCWPLLVENELMNRHVASRLLEFIWRHGRFLHDKRNYVAYSNHGIFSSIALLRIALSFPEFRDSSKWETTAIDRMERQLEENFSSNGVHKEFSPWYQIWCAAIISKYMEDCKLSGIELSPGFFNNYSKIVEAVPCFIYPDNTISLAGDSGLEPNEKLMRRFLAEILRKPHKNTVQCKETGVFVMRSQRRRFSDPQNESCLMAFFSNKAKNHDHIDPLNIELYSRGQKWITDSGRYAYEPKKIQRKFVRSQRAHNTIIPFIARNNVEPGRQDRLQSPTIKRPQTHYHITESETFSLPDNSPETLEKLKTEFLEKNKGLLSSVHTDTPARKQTLEKLFDRINTIKDPTLKIEILKHLEGTCTEILREKIFVMIALVYMETNNDSAMKKYLEKVVELKSNSEYYNIAIQLLNTADEKYEDKSDKSSLSSRIGMDQKMETRPVPFQQEPGSKNSETGDKQPEADSFNQLPIRRNSKTDILTWISKKGFDYLEGSFCYTSNFSHSRAVLFVKPHYFIIVDKVKNKQQRMKIEQTFHFPPEVNVEDLGDGKYMLSSHDSLYCLMTPLIFPENIDSKILRGQTEPFYQGWYSGHYNELLPASTLVNQGDNMIGTHYLVYLLVPTGTTNPTRTRIRSTHPNTWNGHDDKPIRVWINDPAYRVLLSFMPSENFIRGSKTAPGAPVIKIQRFNN